MLRMHALRLTEGELLKEAIESFVRQQKITAGTVISAVGSLSRAHIRMAGAQPDAQDIRTYSGSFEIVSLIGNVGPDRTHLHVSISDADGHVIGGHLKEGCVVHTTVELVIAADDDMHFTEAVDSTTGFGELKIIQQ
jgi:predicted DNA-binding protein with PD1-like motif